MSKAKGDVRNRKLKRKMAEESTMTEEDTAEQLLCLRYGKSTNTTMNLPSSMFNTHTKSPRVLLTRDSSSSPTNDQVQEETQFSCKFCEKKFLNAQGLGGHQKAHKRERIFFNAKKELEKNPLGFRPTNFQFYLNSFSPMPNGTPMQSTPFSCNLAPPTVGYGTNNGIPSSWGVWRLLNTESVGLCLQNPSLSESAAKPSVDGSFSRVGAAFGGLRRIPTIAATDSPSADLDLSLKL